MAIQELTDVDLDPLVLNGLEVARILQHQGPPPSTTLRFDGRDYQYERSFPIKGYGAALPNFLRARLAEGKRPLLIERKERLYVYLSAAD
jgi:hypothetical protein